MAAPKIRELQDEYMLLVEARISQAEAATRGYFFRNDRKSELAGLRTDPVMGMFLWWNAATAYYFASDELIEWWEQNPRTTFAEYAVARGVRSRSMVTRAIKAQEARAEYSMRARATSRRPKTGFGSWAS